MIILKLLLKFIKSLFTKKMKSEVKECTEALKQSVKETVNLTPEYKRPMRRKDGSIYKKYKPRPMAKKHLRNQFSKLF